VFITEWNPGSSGSTTRGENGQSEMPTNQEGGETFSDVTESERCCYCPVNVRWLGIQEGGRHGVVESGVIPKRACGHSYQIREGEVEES